MGLMTMTPKMLEAHVLKSSPMSARNFPPSFWSQHYTGASGGGPGHHGASAADLYSEHYHPGDAWYQYSQHHRAVHDYHHHNMAAQYGGLLLPGSRLHMGSHAPCKAMDWQHPSIDSPYSSYPTMSEQPLTNPSSFPPGAAPSPPLGWIPPTPLIAILRIAASIWQHND
ncbi:hypothetical protein MTP99_009519 [Tenebrio molitor]|nr:hypothetical protein MTP99_009519 [Tenebrio molitor]